MITPPSELNETILRDKLRLILWDHEYSMEEAIDALRRNPGPDNPLRYPVVARLLTTYSWYDLRSFLPADILKDIRSEETLKRIFPPSLRESYRYAGSVLYK